jgi:PAS domain S-box-containing protein
VQQFWRIEPGVRDALAAGERMGAPWAALILAAFFAMTAAFEGDSDALLLALGPCAVCLGLWWLWRSGVSSRWRPGLPLFALAGVLFGSTLFRIAIHQSTWGGTRLAVALVGASLIAPTPAALALVVVSGLAVWGVGVGVVGQPQIGWTYASASLLFAGVLAQLALGLRVRMVRDLVASRDALARSSAHLRRAQKVAGIASAEWDLVRDTISWSEEAYRLFGYEPGTQEPTLEEFVETVVHPDDRAILRDVMDLARRAEGAFQREFRIVRPDGSVRWIEGHGFSMRSSDGGAVVVGTLLDRTPQRETAARERELLRALARRGSASLLGEMAAVLAHELRHPLAAIANFANGGLRRLEAGEAEEVAEALRAIGQEAERASDTIRHVTQASRREPVPLGAVELVGVAERVAKLLEPEARDLGVKIQVRCAAGEARAHANATQVAQIFGNLLRNALEAILESGGGGEIDVSISRDEPGAWLVSVHDTGKGIPTGHAEAIFAPFYSTKRAGTGLGLAVSRRLVESFGGRLWLEPGDAGATFCFTIPRAEEAAHVVH